MPISRDASAGIGYRFAVIDITRDLWFLSLPLAAWALIEALRVRTWSWAVTLILLPVAPVMAWFVCARPFYGYGRSRRRPATAGQRSPRS